MTTTARKIETLKHCVRQLVNGGSYEHRKTHEEAAYNLIDEIAASGPAQESDDVFFVPRVPTDTMVKAGNEECGQVYSCEPVYAAMLAVRPTPPPLYIDPDDLTDAAELTIKDMGGALKAFATWDTPGLVNEVKVQIMAIAYLAHRRDVAAAAPGGKELQYIGEMRKHCETAIMATLTGDAPGARNAMAHARLAAAMLEKVRP